METECQLEMAPASPRLSILDPDQPKPGFWRRQFGDEITLNQKRGDWIFGVILPLVCFYFDPIRFSRLGCRASASRLSATGVRRRVRIGDDPCGVAAMGRQTRCFPACGCMRHVRRSARWHLCLVLYFSRSASSGCSLS